MRYFGMWCVGFTLSLALLSTGSAQQRQYLPGSLSSLIDLEDLPRIDDTVRDGMFSSTDPEHRGRDAGNYLREENGEYVLGEMEGPGVVTRIWSANPHGMLCIYLDDKTKPAIECHFKDIFENRFPPFCTPISGTSSGGWYSYWPIAYEKYCKIAVKEDPAVTAERAETRKSRKVSVSVKGAKQLKLLVSDADDGGAWDHADWADARLIRADGTSLYLSDVKDDTPGVKLVSAKQGWKVLMTDKSNDGNTLSINGKKYEKGLGTHSIGEIVYELKGQFEKFEAEVGLDDEAQAHVQGSIIFRVEVDGKQLYDSGICGFRKDEGALFPGSLYYHVNYTTYPEGTKILPFSRKLSETEQSSLERVLEIWKNIGTCPTENLPTDKVLCRTVKLDGMSSIRIADFEGSGLIYSMKMKLKSEDKRAYRRTIIKMFWDGDDKPAVWAPYGDFFGSGFGQVEFDSLPLGMGKASGDGRTAKARNPDGTPMATMISGDECYCYWVMPFAEGARIEIENGSAFPLELAAEITWRRLDSIPADMGRFCAQWRNERAALGRLIALLDVKGKGKLVGIILSVQGLAEISYLEGNEQYFIDGEEQPSMIGTGTEDFLNGGWYYSTGVFDMPLHGLTEKEQTGPGRTSQYRLQIPDAVTFRTQFKFLMEHGTNNGHLDDDYATMAYFYMLPPLAQDYVPPEASSMNLPRRVLVRPNLPGKGAIGDNKMNVVKMRGGRFAEQVFDTATASCPKELRFWKDISEGYEGTNLAVFFWWPRAFLIRNPKEDPRANDPYRGDVIICDGRKVGDYLEIPPSDDDPAPGTYFGSYWLVKGPDYGNVRISVAGETVVESVDLYADEVQPSDVIEFKQAELPEGVKGLRIEVIGKNDSSKGMKFGLYVEKTIRMLIMPETWRIIGPFPFDAAEPKESFAQSWPPEKKLDFGATYDGKENKVGWTNTPPAMAEGSNYQALDFERSLHVPRDATMYAVTSVVSPSDTDAVLKIGSTMFTAVFLNGEKIYEGTTPRAFAADQDSVDVHLKKGNNTLLIKTSNTRNPWKVGIRLTNAEGKTLRGISYMKPAAE